MNRPFNEIEYKRLEAEVRNMINDADYPDGHPFLDFPNTPESMPVTMLVFILYFTKSKDMTADFVKKCNGKEKGVYSFKKYREGISELIWFYYLLVSVIKTNQIKLQDIFDENHILLENKSKFEFTFSIADPPCKIAFEVKSLSCDPFERENCLVIKDGQSLIKPFFPSLKESEFLRSQTKSLVLTESTHYNQISQNIKRINKKCIGKRNSSEKLYVFGTIFITTSTSFEEFYSYFFNDEYGLYDTLKRSNLDALILASLDAKNDCFLDNLYENEYIQTILPHPSEELMKICKGLRLDNYIALGDNILEFVKEKSKQKYGFYKIFNRDGFLNIIPQEATEEQIEQYLQGLKNDSL